MFKRRKERKQFSALLRLPWHIQERIIEFCMYPPKLDSYRPGDIDLDANYGKSRPSFLRRRQYQHQSTILSPTHVCRAYFELAEPYYYGWYIFWVQNCDTMKRFAKRCPNRASQIRKLGIGTIYQPTHDGLQLSDSEWANVFGKFSGLRAIWFPWWYHYKDMVKWMGIALEAHPSLDSVKWGWSSGLWSMDVNPRPYLGEGEFIASELGRKISKALLSPTLRQTFLDLLKILNLFSNQIARYHKTVGFLTRDESLVMWQLGVFAACLKLRKDGRGLPNGGNCSTIVNDVLRVSKELKPRSPGGIFKTDELEDLIRRGHFPTGTEI